MTEVTRGFCWHQNFVPWGCLPLICGYIHLLNHEKMCISQRLKRFFLNLQQITIVMRPSCWHHNFGPNGLSAHAQGLCLNFFSSVTADFNISSALRLAIQDQWSSGYYYDPDYYYSCFCCSYYYYFCCCRCVYCYFYYYSLLLLFLSWLLLQLLLLLLLLLLPVCLLLLLLVINILKIHEACKSYMHKVVKVFINLRISLVWTVFTMQSFCRFCCVPVHWPCLRHCNSCLIKYICTCAINKPWCNQTVR